MQTAAADGERVMVSVSEAARLKGVRKQTISEKLARLVADGRIATERRGREKVFPLAVYDAAFEETTDPSRIIAEQTKKATAGAIGSGENAGAVVNTELQKASIRAKQLEADERQIRVDQLLGRLKPIEEVTAAMQDCAAAIVRDIDQLPTFADDLAAAVTRGGVAGLREALKAKAREIRQTLERTMKLTATDDDEGRKLDA